ncbi:SUN domain-containing protein 1 [Polymixia lowei]
MSRRSLRLHTAAPYGEDGLLDRSLPYCSSSFSVGGPGPRDSKLFKSRRSQQHSVSCSQSLLHHHHQTPHKQASQSLHNSSLHSVASDASLLSSMLDESSIQERTVVDSFWGKTSSNVLQWLRKGWHHTVTFMSPLTGFFVTRCLPKLLPFVLIVLPPILLSSLFWPWGPSDLLPALPAVNVTDWWSALPLSILPGLSSIFDSTSTRSQSTEDPAEESRDLQAYAEPPYNAPPPAEEEPPFIPLLPTEAQEEKEEEASSVDSTRLLRLERSLSQLWEHVEGGGRRAEQRHEDVLQMYQGLRSQLHSETPGENAEPWVAGQLEERLADLTAQLEEERAQREQTQKQYLVQQENQASRLAELELLLQSLLAKTEEMQESQEAATTAVPSTTVPAPVSVGVDRESHDALLAEVARLEEALGSVRQDLQGLTGCQDGCERLDDMQGTVSAEVSAQVSAQVREELRAVFYGNQLATVSSDVTGDPAALPDSLLQWLTDRYVSGSDLQASLASLELGILRNVSLRLERRGRGEAARGEDVTRTVVHSMGAAGAAVTEEQVQQIVRNALRFYSQDRTGLADYALESGGGSILSTRCSETYGTRTALLSLFGLPLWYFSQSPRVVIQPDVHPGNCWAFKGSNGYLVIRLSMKVIPTAFSLEHMPKALSPSGTLLSAPRDFTVYGLDDDSQENGKLLGSYTYEQDGEALQTYPVSEENDSDYQIIEVRVLSNWGHQEYTCMYRFRVHGTPTDD